MMLVYTVDNYLVVLSDQIIKNGKVKLVRLQDNKTQSYTIENSNFKRVKLDEQGKYKITVSYNDEKYSKTIII